MLKDGTCASAFERCERESIVMYLFLTAWMMLTGCAHAKPAWPKAQAPQGFWKHWGDGQAELNGYAITQPRYGEVRKGEAIFVFVTETYPPTTRQVRWRTSDEYPVMKLNDIRDFQTGVYDYNAMTSAFVRLDGHQAMGLPTKISFSMQEWCGHAWDQGLSTKIHSHGSGIVTLMVKPM